MAETDLDYAKVTGRFGITVADGPDAGDNPDIIWCNEGTVKITPLITYTKVAGGNPDPWSAGHSVISATIDSEGYLTHLGKRFVWIVDLTSTKVNPRIAAGKATHRIEFVNVKADGTPVTFQGDTVRITPAGTDGLGSNDLTDLLPVPSATATPIYRGEQGTGITSAAVEGGDLVLELTDGTTTNAGPLPVGPGGSDEGVASYFAATDSETAAAAREFVAAEIVDPTSPVATGLSATIDAAVPAASTTAQGKVELATVVETATGTDVSRAVTPASVAAVTVAKRTRAPRQQGLMGAYTPGDAAFPTIGSFSAANAATALAGTTSTVYAGEPFPGSYAGTWAAGTAYTTNQTVDTGTPDSWIAVANSTGVTPGTDSTKWRKAQVDPRFVGIGTPLAHARNVYAGTGSFANVSVNLYQNSETSTSRSQVLAFGITTAAIELLLPGTGGKVRITVDGVVDPSGWKTVPTGSQMYRLPVTFASVDTHTVILELSQTNFGGLTMNVNDILFAPQLPYVPLCVVMGDSIAFGQNTDGTRLETFPYFVGKHMGWNISEFGEGGTGFLNPGSTTGYKKFRDRLALVATLNPDVVIAAGGLNDQTSANAGYTTSANQVEITAYVAAAKALMPNALQVIVGPFFTADLATNAPAYNSIKATRDGQLAAIQALGATYNANANAWVAPGLVYIDTLPVWLTGQYSVSGSANVLLSGDGIHPNLKGHRYYAKRIAQALAVVLTPAGLF